MVGHGKVIMPRLDYSLRGKRVPRNRPKRSPTVSFPSGLSAKNYFNFSIWYGKKWSKDNNIDSFCSLAMLDHDQVKTTRFGCCTWGRTSERSQRVPSPAGSFTNRFLGFFDVTHNRGMEGSKGHDIDIFCSIVMVGHGKVIMPRLDYS